MVVLRAEVRRAGVAAEIVDHQPLAEELGRALVKRHRPDERPRCERSGRNGERAQVGARAPGRQREQRSRGEAEHAGAEQAFGEERDAGAGAEREAAEHRSLGVHREPVERDGNARNERVVRHQEMGGVEVTHAAHQHEHGGERRLAPIQSARCQPDE